MLIAPLFGMFNKSIPAQIVLVFTFLAQLLLDFCLGGNASMVGAGKPESGMPLLACPAGKNVLNGIVENMTHGQNSGDIGRGDNDGVGGFIRIGFSCERTFSFPFFVEAVLHLFWLVCFFHVAVSKAYQFISIGGIGE